MIEHSHGNPTAKISFRRLGRLSARWGGLPATVFLFVATTVGLIDARADEPPRNPRSTGNQEVTPRLELPPVDADPAATGSIDPDDKALIDRALRGEPVDAPDSMLGDVVEIIRQRGSLIEGSELSKELPTRAPSHDHPLPHAHGPGAHLPARPGYPGEVPPNPSVPTYDRVPPLNHVPPRFATPQRGVVPSGHRGPAGRFSGTQFSGIQGQGHESVESLMKRLSVAEQLIGTARSVLEADPDDPAARHLAHQMLAHAAKLVQPPPPRAN